VSKTTLGGLPFRNEAVASRHRFGRAETPPMERTRHWRRARRAPMCCICIQRVANAWEVHDPAVAIAWKHAPTPPRGTEIASTARTIPRARALRRKAGVRISAAPSSSSLSPSPRRSRQTRDRGEGRSAAGGACRSTLAVDRSALGQQAPGVSLAAANRVPRLMITARFSWTQPGRSDRRRSSGSSAKGESRSTRRNACSTEVTPTSSKRGADSKQKPRTGPRSVALSTMRRLSLPVASLARSPRRTSRRPATTSGSQRVQERRFT
jgi:hypothetical protein